MAAEKDLSMQVMMVGGRRCGKTSVLAAMKSNFEQQFAESNLTIYCDDFSTLDALDNKTNEINDYFLNAGKRRAFVPDSNPTEEESTYSFTVSVKRSKIGINFVDYPGEWLTMSTKIERLHDLLQESQALIIAIDTPHMIEEDGIFNEYRNFCHRTSELLKKAFEEKYVEHMLVLFVPLKCERYLSDEKMELVLSRTQESYEDLINYFKKYPKKYEVAVTPIFTMGGALFNHFLRGEDGEVKVNPKFKTPETAEYYFPDISVRKPTPRYCEQPVVYLLSYLFQLAENREKYKYDTKGRWGRFLLSVGRWWNNTASSEDYKIAKNQVKENLKKDGDGYKILQDPFKL